MRGSESIFENYIAGVAIYCLSGIFMTILADLTPFSDHSDSGGRTQTINSRN